jgi:hypothetical protein
MSNGEKQKAERTHCKSGHELSDENVKILNKGGGRKYKQCLTCFPVGIGSSRQSVVYERPEGSRMRQALSTGVFGDAMTRADIMRSRG